MDCSAYSVGDVVHPPYFFGALPEGLDKKSFDDPFNTDGWIDHCRAAAQRLGISRSKYLGDPTRTLWRTAFSKAVAYCLSPRTAAQHLVSGLACPRHLLPVAHMIRDVYLRHGKVRVLDIGGGFGDNFFELVQVLPPPMIGGLTYDVIDNEISCALGRSLYTGYQSHPTFTSDYTAIDGSYDIVLVIGTLQYLPSWRAFLASMSDRSERYVYLARSPIANDVESFSTTQLICPTLGSHAGRLLGATRINVVGLQDLRAAMSSWRSCFEFLDTDYSAQFARLPEAQRSVSYYSMAWQR